MNCSKFIDKCKAACCGIVPFPREYLKNYKDKIYDKNYKIMNLSRGLVIAETKNLQCIFLNKDNQCNIYDNRPKICRIYGNESHILLTCKFQDKTGKARNRSEQKKVEKEIKNYVSNLTKIQIENN